MKSFATKSYHFHININFYGKLIVKLQKLILQNFYHADHFHRYEKHIIYHFFITISTNHQNCFVRS